MRGTDFDCIAAICRFLTWDIHPVHQCLGQRIVSYLVWLSNIHNDVGNGICIHLRNTMDLLKFSCEGVYP